MSIVTTNHSRSINTPTMVDILKMRNTILKINDPAGGCRTHGICMHGFVSLPEAVAIALNLEFQKIPIIPTMVIELLEDKEGGDN